MADFARVVDSQGLTAWINLDHVTRITPGLDPRESTTVRFVGGRSMAIPPAQGQSLIRQLNQCCRRRTEK